MSSRICWMRALIFKVPLTEIADMLTSHYFFPFCLSLLQTENRFSVHLIRGQRDIADEQGGCANFQFFPNASHNHVT